MTGQLIYSHIIDIDINNYIFCQIQPSELELDVELRFESIFSWSTI
jgi:hypothetical protein